MVRTAPAIAEALAPAWMPYPRSGTTRLVPKIAVPGTFLCGTLPSKDDGMPSGAPHHLAGATNANALIMLSKASGKEAFHPVVGHHSKTP
jgi:hypothetical protein